MDWCASLKSAGYPVILTVRAENEGGKWKGSIEDRDAILTRALPNVSAVDIELCNGVSAEIRERAEKMGVRLLISSHDFDQTPPLDELRARVDASRIEGADIAKIATMINSPKDVATLSLLTVEASKDTPVCVIGMGDQGVATRLSLPALGSALAYGYLDTPGAPGQLPCAVLCRRLRETIPAFDEDMIIRKRVSERA